MTITFDIGKVTINDAAFDYVFNMPEGAPVGRWMQQKGMKTLALSKMSVHVRSGALKAALEMKQDRKGAGRQQQVRIGAYVGKKRGYALYHHEGTLPHEISGRRGGQLVFTYRGKKVMKRTVRHPGNKPNPYLTRPMGLFMRL